jgi:hypothetical protein
MKGKKPLILIVLVVALLAVALILPAAAVGGNDSQPTAVISYSSNSNNFIDQELFQGGSTFLVKQFGSDLTGHFFAYVTKGNLAGLTWGGDEFWGLTFPFDSRGTRAEFWVNGVVLTQPHDLDFALPDEFPMRVVLIDVGGPPHERDWEQLYMFGSYPLLDPTPGHEETLIPSGNVVIHN